VTALFDGNPKTGVNAPLTVTFTDQSVGASGWSWNFGDGDSTNATGIQNPIHTYMKTGIYRVNLTTTSIGGYNTTSKPAFITVGPIVSPIAPVANFTATPVNGSAPLTVNFRDLSVNATTWYWTFGDNWMANGVNMSNSTLMNPVHTYLTAGNYTVSLNVTNSAGSNVTKKMGYINVTNSTDKIGVTFNGGTWWLDYNGNGTYDGPVIDSYYSFGGPGNTTVIGDWNGDGRTKVGVFNNGTWFLDYNGDGFYSSGVDKAVVWGAAGSIPVVGDWNGDGKTKIGVYNSTGLWYLDYNGTGIMDPRGSHFWGGAGWTPFVGDWNGDGILKVGVYRDGVWYLDYNGNGVLDMRGFHIWGAAGWTPFVGDWNRDGTTKVGVYKDGLWYFDYNGTGILDPSKGFHNWGAVGWTPLVGDWNGDVTPKVGVYKDSLWYLDYNGTGILDPSKGFHNWGAVGWTPIVGKWS
jgi:PKD repeat protein